MTSGPISHEREAGRSDAAGQWARAQELLHEALARAADERSRYLDEACADAAMRREIDQLLAAHERPGLLDDLATAVIAPLQRGRLDADPGAGAPLDLARYTMLERLGGGGMGVVYRARDTRLARDVALKFLSPHLSADEAANQRFIMEARATAALEHPNICTIHEVGETSDGRLYIVMAYYDGETLDRVIARGPLPAEAALRIATEIARGLAQAHERGIVHRDIKPANVMITGDGLVKVLDFGIAKLSDTTLVTGGALGTAAYMSPEQAFGDEVDRRSDLWSLGVVLYEMLAGTRPFQGANAHAVLRAILSAEPAPLSAHRADIPPELDALLARALARQPTDRYATAHAMLRDLGRVASALRQPSTARTSRPRLGAAPPLEDTPLTRSGERRPVTVVATVTHDYGALVERLVPDDLARLEHALRDAAVEAASRHGGIVNQFTADRLVMLFGVPATHEDDLLRAARATLELHARARELSAAHTARAGTALRLRSGMDAGLVIAQRLRTGAERFRINGAADEMARRLAAHAAPDEILVGPDCQRLCAPVVQTEPAAPLVLEDGRSSVLPHRLLREWDIDASSVFGARRGLSPFAGRARELARSREQLASALAGSGGMLAVIGEAGTGKSRLVFELRRHAGDAGVSVVQGRCDALGRTTPFLPFVQALRGVLGLGLREDLGDRHDEIVARIREIGTSLDDFLPLYLSLLAIPSDVHRVPRHLQGAHFQAALLEALTAVFTMHATRAPSVLALEDWHWADEASRELLRQLTHIVPAYPLLLVVTSRPEHSVTWGTAEHQVLLHLGPLDRHATLEIARAALGAARVPEQLVQQLHERSGGNPFFLEEMCHALREEGVVDVRDGAAAVSDATRAVQLPDTVQTVIRSRIDRLEPELRDVLRVSSVIGRDFSRGLLERMLDGRVDLARALEQLKESGLVVQTSVVPEPAYRFKHVLTQEVAYDSLLEHQRQALHTAAGRAIELSHAGRLDEHFGQLAHHFSRAREWWTAIRYGSDAADRATALCQFFDASSILEHVQEWLSHLPERDEHRELLADLLLRQERLCETLGLRARQLHLADELIALLAPGGASARLAEAYLRQGDVCTLVRRFDAADRALGTALRISCERGDQAGERNALRSIGLLRWYQGRSAEALDMVQSALAIDRARGDEHGVAGDLANLGMILRSLGRMDEAVHMLEDALTTPVLASDPVKRSFALHNLANAHRDRGEPALARRYLEDAAAIADEHRLPIQSSFHLTAIAHLELQAGHVEESLRRYRQAVELSRRSRHAVGLAQSLRVLGDVLMGLGQHAAALPHLREAAAIFSQLEDHAAEATIWSGVAAAYEHNDNHAEAHAAWQRAGVLYARERDARGELAALEGSARAVRHQGDPAAAIPYYENALTLAIRLGDRRREVVIRNTLGIILWEGLAFEQALAQYESALRVARELGDDAHEGLLLNSLGATLARLHRHEEARTALEEAWRLNESTGQSQLAAHSHATLGDTYLELGRHADARRCFESSLAVRRELGDRRGEGWMLQRLARVAAAAGAVTEAQALAARAAAIADLLGDPTLHAAAAQQGAAAGHHEIG